MIRIAIIGAGKGGTALLELFSSSPEVKITGIADRRKGAPGLKKAAELGIPAHNDFKSLQDPPPDILINATGDPAVGNAVRGSFGETLEIIESRGARLLWELVDVQTKAKNDLTVLYQTGLHLARAGDLNEVLGAVLKSATELTDTASGAIALINNGAVEVAATLGLGDLFSNLPPWKTDDNLTSMILSGSEPVEFPDIADEPLLNGTPFTNEGATAMLASQLRLNGEAKGILYLMDFKAREFTDRHKGLINLFCAQAAHAISRLKLQKSLEESLKSLESIFNDSQDMIVAADIEGRIRRFSKGGERILGYSQDEVSGRKVYEFYRDPGDRKKITRLIKERGAVFNYETTMVRKDGAPVDISLTISELRDASGNVIGTVGVSKDITIEKRLRKELEELNRNLEEKVLERTRDLEKANRELKKASELKGKFIANASHELRTPLHSIIGFSEVLIEKTYGGLTEKQARFINTILTSGKHLLHLVNNILDLARIEAGKAQLNCEVFDLAKTFEEILGVIRPLADKKLITLSSGVEDACDFNGDKVKLKQILYNLVSNAIKFTPEGGKVTLSSKRFTNYGELEWAPPELEFLKISVEDTGPGIKPEDRERVFDEFEQLDPSKATEGTGLGLPLTKKLVEMHGGVISIGGVWGHGAVFDVYLPAGSEQGAQGQLTSEDLIEVPDINEGQPFILVVEDDRPTIELLTIHLTQAGYRVVHAYDGEQALIKAKEIRPFGITLDIMLPKKDGWEVLQALKAEPETKDIPVLIHSIIENRELAFALGATDYLVKPVDHSTLTEKLKNLVAETRKKLSPASVLVISSDPVTQDQLYNTLQCDGLLLHSAADAQAAMELASAVRPNAVMVDVEDSDKGFETIGMLKANPALKDIPLFIITSDTLPEEQRRALTGQVERILRKDALRSGEFIAHLKSLEMLYPEKAGLVDGITMLFNKRYLKIRIAQEVTRSQRYGIPMVYLVVEIDHFGNYLAKKGAYYGNLVLKKIADLLKRSIRGSDILVRSGRSSFGLILTNTTITSGEILARRFLAMIRDYPFLYEEVQPTGRITISAGAVELQDKGYEELLAAAEEALLEAKKKGGNRVESVGGERPPVKR